MINRGHILRGIVLLLVLSLPSCQRGVGDGGFISGKPCGRPCFLGITPDITTEAELKEIIHTEPRLATCEEYDFTSEGGNRGFRCPIASFSLRDGKVSNLRFTPSTDVTVEEMLAKYGDPDNLVIFEANLPEEAPKTGIRIIYEGLCMDVVGRAQERDSYALTPDTQVLSVGYMGHEGCQIAGELTEIAPWRGYGDYERTDRP